VGALNAAMTDPAAAIETVQVVEVPEQAPPHPPKLDPLAGTSLNVTEMPFG